jgi:hypothetical protein
MFGINRTEMFSSQIARAGAGKRASRRGMGKPSILWVVPTVALLAGCANTAPTPRTATSDCGFHFTGGSGALGLLGAMGAFDRPAGPDCTYSAPAAASITGVPSIVEEPDTAVEAPQQFGQPVINSGDCIGAVVNGVCHGTQAPGAPTVTCYGQMLNGIFTGPMF